MPCQAEICSVSVRRRGISKGNPMYLRGTLFDHNLFDAMPGRNLQRFSEVGGSGGEEEV
jgi:hypothetical protein